MKRRRFLGLSSAALLALALPWGRAEASVKRHVRPSDPEWPKAAEWSELRSRVHGRLVQPVDPGPSRNPFWLEEQPGGTQSRGWADAWEARPSTYAVAAETAEDVAAAVDFARQHGLRLVVKGTGHDYLGRSCAGDSLLVWTHPMRKVTVHDRFVPQGAPAGHPGLPAVSAQAGARWLEVYGEVTTRHGRYVQGGGCASVGAAGGFPQGGGFGSFSKKFGTGAAGMVEAEVVTSDGRILTANEFQHPDLFWALRGGGGGTFGVVTRLTLMTHDLPPTFGAVTGTIQAASDEAFRALVDRMRRFYCEALNNEHWGEQIAFRPDNSVEVSLTFQGLDQAQAEAVVAPLRTGLPKEAYQIDLKVLTIPARDMWNLAFWKANHPDQVIADPEGRVFWWAGNQGEVSMYWYTYQSRYIPLKNFQDPGFTDTLFEASRHWRVSLHVNKGLAGAAPEALERGRKTSVNPVSTTAAALAILGAGTTGAPDPAQAKEKIARVDAAMRLLREATPKSGSYANEADYFTQDWQTEFWGVHYPRLLAIKERYDPAGLFHVHHGVGSEGWSRDGMTRT